MLIGKGYDNWKLANGETKEGMAFEVWFSKNEEDLLSLYSEEAYSVYDDVMDDDEFSQDKFEEWAWERWQRIYQ